MQKQFYVYILTNKTNSTFYIGITNDLERRVYEHKQKFLKGFTQTYNLTKVVYFEQYITAYEAISREKQLKRWHRQWKINLIQEHNPLFRDLLAYLDAETSSA